MPLAVHIIYSYPHIALTHGKGQKLVNDQSLQGGIFAHTSLPISTPCSLPAAENLGLYILFPQQQPPSLISVWKLWRSIGNRKKKNHSPVTVLLLLTTPIPLKLSVTHPWASGDPVQDLSLDLGKETVIYNSWILWLPYSGLYYLYLMEFKLSLKLGNVSILCSSADKDIPVSVSAWFGYTFFYSSTYFQKTHGMQCLGILKSPPDGKKLLGRHAAGTVKKKAK